MPGSLLIAGWELASRRRRPRADPVLAGPSRDPRLQWIAAQCHQLPFSAGPLNNYYCAPQDVG